MSNYFTDLPNELQEKIYWFVHRDYMNSIREEIKGIFYNLYTIEYMYYKIVTDVEEQFGNNIVQNFLDSIYPTKKEEITEKLLDEYNISKKIFNSLDGNKNIEYLFENELEFDSNYNISLDLETINTILDPCIADKFLELYIEEWEETWESVSNSENEVE